MKFLSRGLKQRNRLGCIQLGMNTELEEALNKYADENHITPEEAVENILSSFLIAAGSLNAR